MKLLFDFQTYVKILPSGQFPSLFDLIVSILKNFLVVQCSFMCTEIKIGFSFFCQSTFFEVAVNLSCFFHTMQNHFSLFFIVG